MITLVKYPISPPHCKVSLQDTCI